jgi:hypothetical protein
MNMQLWVLAISAGVGAVLGVALAEWLAPVYAIKLVIVALGGGIGAGIGTQITKR